MEVNITIQYIITIGSIIGGILAWVAKIRWSKEYKEAKEAQIDQLKEKVEFYKERTSETLLNHHKKQKIELENIIKDLEFENNNKVATVQSLNSTIKTLTTRLTHVIKEFSKSNDAWAKIYEDEKKSKKYFSDSLGDKDPKQ